MGMVGGDGSASPCGAGIRYLSKQVPGVLCDICFCLFFIQQATHFIVACAHVSGVCSIAAQLDGF
jgi:hypothetical protein